MSRTSFKTRNLYYLRMSEQSVLPVYVYLDERHLDWMSDQVLQHVLSDLRPRILSKLLGEAGIFPNSTTAKMATVDTHRGDNYQFCFFLRQTEPHSVAIKTRNYVARKLPRASGPASTASATITRRPPRKRKTRSSSHLAGSPPSRSSKKQKNDMKKNIVTASDYSEESQDEEEVRSTNKKACVIQSVNVNQDEVIDLSAGGSLEGVSALEDDTFDLSMEEEEEKPKPTVQLNYKGFGIYGQCLCIVVEPWPLKRTTPHVPQELGGISSDKSKQQRIAQSVPTTARAQTPLFLADDNDDAPDDQQNRTVTTHWDDFEMKDDSDDDIESGGMMAFSQALNIAGDSRPGAVEDDNEIEGEVLFGDADEVRQL